MVSQNASMKFTVNYEKMHQELLETYGLFVNSTLLRQHIEYGVPIKKDTDKAVDALFRRYVIDAHVSLTQILAKFGDLESAEQQYQLSKNI